MNHTKKSIIENNSFPADRTPAELWEEIIRLRKEIEVDEWVSRKTNEGIRLLYKELEKKSQKLQELDQLKSNLLSTVSHELRTPLTVIRGGVALIRNQTLGKINDDQQDTLNDVLGSVDRLTNIINNLLDLSKLEAGRVELRTSDFNVPEVINEVLKLFQPEVVSRSIRLDVDLASPPTLICADKDKIIQILTNLIANAIKFTPKGGRITVGKKTSEFEVEIFVKDTGIGIAPNDLPKLFHKFEQFGRTAGPGEKGTGLGLAICKEIIDLHDGEIWAESKPNQGSVFHFTLPRALSDDLMCQHVLDLTLKKLKGRKIQHLLTILLLRITFMRPAHSLIEKETNDEMLTCLKDSVRQIATHPMDRVLKFSSDTLMVLLDRTDQAGAFAVANKVRHLMKSKKAHVGTNEFLVDVQYGIATYPNNGGNAKRLLDLATLELTRKKRILIVDDEPDIAKELRTLLEMTNRFEVTCIFDGEAAFEKAKSDRPDLMILDITLPRMSGYELIGRFKQHRDLRNIPIIVLTGHSVDEDYRDVIGPGAIPVIYKPEGFDKILEHIEEIL